MKILYLLAILGGISELVAFTDLRPGVRCRFGLRNENIDKDHAFAVPKNVTEAKDKGWMLTDRPRGAPLPSVTMFCAPELTFCVLYDDTGYIAGSQVAVKQDRFKNAAFDWATQGYKEWIVNGVKYWSISQFFVNEPFLKISPEERESMRDSTKVLQMSSVWLTGFNGQLYGIPTNRQGLDLIWTEQTCTTGMGQHYVYNLTNTECRSDLMFPWFLLYYNGQLVGTLWNNIGTYPPEEGQTDFFERPITNPDGSGITKFNFPDVAKCWLELARNAVIQHFWFVDNPWDIVCSDPMAIWNAYLISN